MVMATVVRKAAAVPTTTGGLAPTHQHTPRGPFERAATHPRLLLRVHAPHAHLPQVLVQPVPLNTALSLLHLDHGVHLLVVATGRVARVARVPVARVVVRSSPLSPHPLLLVPAL